VLVSRQRVPVGCGLELQQAPPSSHYSKQLRGAPVVPVPVYQPVAVLAVVLLVVPVLPVRRPHWYHSWASRQFSFLSRKFQAGWIRAFGENFPTAEIGSIKN
jgi:hypothetical protein